MANLIKKSIVAGLLLGTSSMASAATTSAGGIE
ncbi:secreted protein, partial [marine sediment metagenome]